MLSYRTSATTAIFLIIVVDVVVEGQSQSQNLSLPPQLDAQKIVNNEFGASEVSLSLVVNQLALLKILTESSTMCSLHERELKEMRNLKLELDVKTGELKNDFLIMKNELQNMTTMSLDVINTKKEEFQSMTTASLDEIKRLTEEGKDHLKEAVFNVSQQQAAIMTTTTAPPPTTPLTTATLITTTPPLECEDSWSEYQSSCYKVFKSANYYRAAENCRAHGAYLASIGSEGENYFVYGLIVKQTIIGLTDANQEGVYTWQDGSPFNFSKWGGGQPNGGESENCIYIDKTSHWRDYRCEVTWPDYICEKRLQ